MKPSHYYEWLFILRNECTQDKFKSKYKGITVFFKPTISLPGSDSFTKCNLIFENGNATETQIRLKFQTKDLKNLKKSKIKSKW